MTPTLSDTELRHWLVHYLITNIGCGRNDIDLDAPLSDLGVGSSDAVVLSGELAELLGRPVSPVEFWQHPTLNGLVEYLTTPESEVQADTADSADRSWIDEPIAVIGMGCRFPSDVHGPEAFWQFLCEGRSAVGEVPPDRWAPFDTGSPEVAVALSGTTRWGSFLADIDAFDAEFFEISPREAAKMDPQQRLLLEVAYEALEHAGIPADSLRRTQTGVFVGACASEYGYLASTDLSQVDAWSGTGGALSIIANRVSYFFDLHGPSATVDTACSSSLVAVHLACQSLRTGDSNLAIAAGVNLLLSPAVTRSFDQAEAMSPTGQCHAFDASADGFVRGEGCGVVVLKRLSDALRDGDRVLAVVRGSAVNQDGRSNGLMAPNPAAQMAVLRAAYANAGVEPRHVDYVEAHGIGTLLGDPIEARALGTVLGRARPPSARLLIGAVKSNLGNLEAAGIAGFIKAVLAVQRGRIPANLNFHTPNPHIPFEDLRLKVVAEHTDWPSTGQPRRAGVSSFGFGGTNAHVVLEQAPVPEPVAVQPKPVVSTLVISGKWAERVASTAGMLAQWMEGEGAGVALADVAHTLNHHRARHAKFATVAALDRVQAVAGLRALAAGRSADGVMAPHQGACRPGTVFVYSGQGSQWAGMGRQLLADEPEFAAAVAELEPVFVEQVGFSLRQVLAGGEALVGIDRIQPVLVGMQLALTALWASYGVVPDAVIGHSMGEVTAAVVAGALTPAEGLQVIATRSRLMARRIEVDVASHHPIIDPVLPELRTALGNLAPQPPTIPVIATTGAAPVFDADYWAVNLRNPVRFSQAVAAAGADHGTFVEVSPHPLLTYAISDTLAQVHHHSIGTLARDTHDTLTFHTNLNATHTTQPPNTDHPPGPHPVIPTTPWHHTHHWVSPPAVLSRNGISVPGTQPGNGVPDETDSTAWRPAQHWITIKERMEAAVSAPRSGTLLGEHIGVATTPPVHLWQAWLKPEAKPYPGFHRIRGVDVVPVSVLLQTLSTAAAECGASALSDVRFEYPIVVDQSQVIQVVADDESVTVSSASAADAPAHRWIRHASARISHRLQDEPDDTFNTPDQETAGFDESLASQQRAWGIEGQPFEWSIDSCRSAPDALHVDVDLPEASAVALLDAAVHVARLVDSSDPRLMLPAAAESVRFHAGFADSHGAVEVRRRGGDGDEFIVDIVVTAPDGSTCVDIRALRYAAMESGLEQVASPDESTTLAWSEMPAEKILSELEIRLRAILGRELGMPASAVHVDRPFPELGLDSMMAMTVLREAKRLVGFDLSATMLWNHPTISSLVANLTEMLVAQRVLQGDSQEVTVDATPDSGGSVLDALFDSVESATARSESGI
ncbi:MAG: beta-ketoacyl synthase N-terminal-like domain-containing protein [Mycobacterium sp.]|uniref:type I polyketide synthase n=2 Tax=Mycobacterium sp. TaxID=1785 RepID=UPI003BB4D7C4